MSVRYRIDSKLEIVFIKAEGILTDADLEKLLVSMQGDPDFRPSLNQLGDFRAVDFMDLTTSAVRVLAARISDGEQSQRAIVVSSELAFGMSRMYQILTDENPAKIKVFKGMTEARKWLGLDFATPLVRHSF